MSGVIMVIMAIDHLMSCYVTSASKHLLLVMRDKRNAS